MSIVNIPLWGENLYFLFSATSLPSTADVVGAWYNQIEDYDFNNPGWQQEAVSFTQVVWAATSVIGVGIASGDGGRNYVVVNYLQPGNVNGQFEENVLPPVAT